MERILHRGNTMARVCEARRAQFNRIEVDVRWYRGEFRVCHDVSFGPFVFGSQGVEALPTKRTFLRFSGNLLTLQELLAVRPLPLLIDLKGSWNTTRLQKLVDLLVQYKREEDALCSESWSFLDICSTLADYKLFYSVNEKTVDSFLELLTRRDFPGVSMRAEMLIEHDVLMATLQDLDVLVYAWNFPSRSIYERLAYDGLDGAIIDDFDW